ncbi:MAG: glycosyl transferase [candidate division Zixibacteria bacterium RBG_16_48_11]|nr:MAG: glycosyl transferase [candidate division Zixibacteria bacterium RBG_16_48_11]
MRIALVHDWLTGMRGGEKCLEALCQIYPQAEIYTLLHNPGSVSREIESKKIHNSFIQNLPWASKKYQYYLPLFPTAIEQFNLTDFDLVISSSHCVAKGVLTRPETCHICYCYTPMRYAWEMYYTYFNSKNRGWLFRHLIPFIMNYLRSWDESSSRRVDNFVAISQHVQKRIKKHYRRESEVIYPPVAVESYELSQKSGDYYLIVSALVPYKRVDLAVEAFNRLGERLLVVGEGPEKKRLQKIAGKKVEFISWQSFENLKNCYYNCKALIFPGEEDFGIVPVEAQACGKPVIAYGRGGVLETVVGFYPEEDEKPNRERSGVFFKEQTVESLIQAVKLFEKTEFDPHTIRKNTLKFEAKIFKDKMKTFIAEKFKEHQKNFGL